MVFLLNQDDITFPDAELAEDDGLLAVGGDLSLPRLLLAYRSGIFPWYGPDTPILWYSPHQRYVIFPHQINISKSMRQLMRRQTYTVSVNQSFKQVIQACAQTYRPGQDGTWITDDMQQAYLNLHQQGHATSVEVWQAGQLVGGLYGVCMGRVFCGESMFSRKPNASKLALIYLCQNMGFELIDCQLHNEHLESMGGRYISREEYRSYFTNTPAPGI